MLCCFWASNRCDGVEARQSNSGLFGFESFSLKSVPKEFGLKV